jgi:sugar transferase (PEP-CTERM/EpsH1 system associated)
MNRRPQILYIVHRVPYPPDRGDRIRSFHILEFLSKRADIHLATLADESVSSDTMQALHSRCKRVAVERLSKARWLRGATSLMRGRSTTEGLFWSPRLHRIIRKWAYETHFDMAFLYCSSVLQYLSVHDLRDVPAIVDLVDVDSQKWFDYAAMAPGLKSQLFRLEGNRTRRLETEVSQRASSIVLVSEAEAALFRRICPNDHTCSVPNGVNIDYFQCSDGDGRPGHCVFVGALDYRANIDGICRFCGEVWPQVRAAYPTATLAIVGRNPVRAVVDLQAVAGVEVFASVADVRPYLAEASVVVVPLRIARGIQNKVLEGMAAGRAVIASREALEGIDVRSGENVIQADSPAQWSSNIVRLFNEPRERTQIAQAGRAFVANRHDWTNCLSPIASLLASVSKLTDLAKPLITEFTVDHCGQRTRSCRSGAAMEHSQSLQ